MRHHSTVRPQRPQVKNQGDFSIRIPCKEECCNKSRGEYLENRDDSGGVYSPFVKTVSSKAVGRKWTSLVGVEASIPESEAGLYSRKVEDMLDGNQSIKGKILFWTLQNYTTWRLNYEPILRNAA